MILSAIRTTPWFCSGQWQASEGEPQGGGGDFATYLDNNWPIAPDGWEVRLETAADRQERWSRRSGEDLSKAPRNYDDRAIVYKTRFAGLLQETSEDQPISEIRSGT